MNDAWEKLLKELEKRAVEGKISCAQARKLAEDLNIPYENIAKAADEKEIKIHQCQLGCF